jgi:phosphoribosylformylglycinamidine synthase
MRAGVITFPGTNRDRDIARALRSAGARVSALWHEDRDLPAGIDLVVLPGGFAYGDYLRCGAIAAHAGIMDAVRAHAKRGGLILGVCNGFQILCEAGILPGILLRNAGRLFLCRWQPLRVERTDTPFTSGFVDRSIVTFPIAHGEGNYTADAETLTRLEGEGRIAFRYCDAAGVIGAEDPNGAANAIAGVYSENRRVLGLMPHPENAIEAVTGGSHGARLFAGLAAAGS